MGLNFDDFLITKIRSQFLCCTPINKIPINELLKNITWDEQETLINNTINSELLQKYPIKSSFQIAFIKTLINQIESQQIEVHDQLYESLCKHYKREHSSDFCYKHYQFNGCSEAITIKESVKIISSGTTGLCSWQAATALAQYVLEHKNQFAGKNVIELGAGTGLTGIALAQFCNPNMVTLTDGDKNVLSLMRENVEINCPNGEAIECLEFNWADVESSKLNYAPDIIMAADVVYDSDLFPLLINAIHHCFEFSDDDSQCWMLLAATIRNEDTFDAFLMQLAKSKFHAVIINNATSNGLLWDDGIPVRIVRITKQVPDASS